MRGVSWPCCAGFLLLAPLACMGPGCTVAGRVDFLKGRELDLQGDHRGAYLHYYDAYRRSGSRAHLEARNRAGWLVAESHRLKGLADERAGKLDEALDHFCRASEYDPERADLPADLRRVELRRARIQEAFDRAAACPGSREAFALLRDLREEAAARPEILSKTLEAAGALVDRELAAAEPDSETLPVLDSCIGALRGLGMFLDRIALEAAEDPRPPDLGALVEARRRDVDEAARAIEERLEAERERLSASASEGAGHPDAAAASYARALHLCPWRPEIREGLARSTAAADREASGAILKAMGRKDWEEALAQIGRLDRLFPNSSVTRRRADLCIREVREALLKQGRELRDRGLHGNALCAFLRLRALGLGTADLDREIAFLEEGIAMRTRFHVQVSFPASRAGEGGPSPPGSGCLAGPSFEEPVRTSIQIGSSEITFLERPVRLALGSDAAGDGRTASPTGGPSIPVDVLDAVFEHRERREEAGTLESRFVSDFRSAENPEWVRARDEFEALGAETARARADLDASLPGARDCARVRLEIAEGRMWRAGAALEGTPPAIPSPVWQVERTPIHRVLVDAALSVMARIDGEIQEVRADLSAVDQEVEGDAGRGIPPRTPDVPGRLDALGRLAGNVAAEIAARVEAREAALRARLLSEAREKLGADAFEPAVENLVTFIYAERREGPGARFQEAVDLLRRITGCDLGAALQEAKIPVVRSRRF